jgi:hypothetical protein
MLFQFSTINLTNLPFQVIVLFEKSFYNINNFFFRLSLKMLSTWFFFQYFMIFRLMELPTKDLIQYFIQKCFGVFSFLFSSIMPISKFNPSHLHFTTSPIFWLSRSFLYPVTSQHWIRKYEFSKYHSFISLNFILVYLKNVFQ